MSPEVKCLLHNSLPIKASGNYTTIYQVIHFWWLGWDNLDAGFLFLTHSNIQDDDHSPPSASFFLGIIPLLFQICSSTFSLSVAWPVHMYETTLYGGKQITRGWYWRIRKKKWFLYLIFLNKKPFTEAWLKAHWLRWNCADFSA